VEHPLLTKVCGGLRIINLDIQNVCLLSKWVFKLLNEDGVWQQVLKRKYLRNSTSAQVSKKPGDSQFWGGLLEARDHLLTAASLWYKNGEKIRFWEDWWIGHEPLMKRSLLCTIFQEGKNQIVASALSSRPLNISFRRALRGDKLRMWFDLVTLVLSVSLGEAGDSWVRLLGTKSTYSVKAMYSDMMLSRRVPRRHIFWKLKLPLKIKIFLWYLEKGVTLTKDNLIKRNWKGEGRCCFCYSNETIQHLFLTAI
jgi:hypothetical protein